MIQFLILTQDKIQFLLKLQTWAPVRNCVIKAFSAANARKILKLKANLKKNVPPSLQWKSCTKKCNWNFSFLQLCPNLAHERTHRGVQRPSVIKEIPEQILDWICKVCRTLSNAIATQLAK